MTTIAMSVDFVWPWWVFTVIAVCVAAASVLLFTRVRQWFARGIFVTLFVEAVVIAAVAPAVMSSTGSMSAMSPAQFAQQADANCRALTQRIAPLGNPTTLPGITRKLDVVVPAFSMAPAGAGGAAAARRQAERGDALDERDDQLQRRAQHDARSGKRR